MFKAPNRLAATVSIETSQNGSLTLETLLSQLFQSFASRESLSTLRARQQKILDYIRAISRVSAKNKEIFCDCGAVPIIASVFDHVPLVNNADFDVLYVTVRILRSLSVVSKNQAAIGNSGVVKHLYRCLKSNMHPCMQSNAAAVLWNIASDAENKLMIGKTGGVGHLLICLRETMRELNVAGSRPANGLFGPSAAAGCEPPNALTVTSHDLQNVIGQICGALRHLAQEYENLNYFVAVPGGIKCLTDLLWHEEGKKNSDTKEQHQTRQEVAFTLNLCMKNPEAQLEIEKTHCIAQLVRVLQEFGVQLTKQTAAKYAELIKQTGEQRLGAAAHIKHQAESVAAEEEENDEHETMIIPIYGKKLQNTGQPANAAATAETPATSIDPLNVFGNTPWSGVEIEECIGKGAFAKVFRARYHGFPVAVKLLKDVLPDNEHGRNRVLQEGRMLAVLRHPNIVQLMGHTTHPDGRVAFIFEFCSRGALKDVLPNERSMLRRLKFGKDIVAGLNWLHAHNIVHRDLKCANVLITDEYTAKVSDLGLALNYYDGINCSQFRGNIKYSAPEILAARLESGIDDENPKKNSRRVRYPYGPQSDVYSFALILWELVTRQPLFQDINGRHEITVYVCGGNRPPLVAGWPPTLQNMLSACWHDNPMRRPSFTAIQKDFGTMIADVIVPDPLARVICSTLWSNGNETRRVPYAEFERVLQQKTKIDLVNASLCYRRCLQVMLCESSEFLVPFESVCNMVQAFGCMDPLDQFLFNVLTLFEQPWFFGFVRVADAKQMLTEQYNLDPLSGYYLVRFSDNLPGAFALMTIERDGSIIHRRIRHQYTSQFFIEIDKRDYAYDNLFQMHEAFLKMPNVLAGKRPLPGAPFQCFFAANPLVSASNNATSDQTSRKMSIWHT